MNTAVNHNTKEKLLQTGKLMQQQIPFDYLAIDFDDPGKIDSATSFLRIGFNEYQTIGINELITVTGTSANELIKMLAASGKETVPDFFNNEAFEKITQTPSLQKLLSETFDINSMLSFPLLQKNGESFSFCFYSRRPDTYSTEHIAQLHRLRPTLTKAFEQVSAAKKRVLLLKLKKKNRY